MAALIEQQQQIETHHRPIEVIIICVIKCGHFYQLRAIFSSQWLWSELHGSVTILVVNVVQF